MPRGAAADGIQAVDTVRKISFGAVPFVTLDHDELGVLMRASSDVVTLSVFVGGLRLWTFFRVEPTVELDKRLHDAHLAMGYGVADRVKVEVATTVALKEHGEHRLGAEEDNGESSRSCRCRERTGGSASRSLLQEALTISTKQMNAMCKVRHQLL